MDRPSKLTISPGYVLRSSLALAMLAFHLYVVFYGPPQPIYFRGAHLLFALVLIFLTFPGATVERNTMGRVVDLVWIAASIGTIGYMWVNTDYFLTRFAYVDPLSVSDMVFAVLIVAAVLEAARRTSGLALPLTAGAFLLYGLTLGRLGVGELLDQLYMTQEGIFGIPLTVAATYIVLFVVFGSLVEKTGTGKLFMDIAMALAGASSGGPAKVAVMTSAMFGTISGSSTANVVTTGTFTIPLMKRIGYKPAFAGAVEAVASTGGQIMPPIMGASAFVMAEFLGVGYTTVIGLAILPAFLYFFAVFMAVHFEARRLGLTGVPRADLPAAGKVLRERGHQFLPIVVIVGALYLGRSTPWAATLGLLSVVPVALMRKSTRKDVTIRNVYEGCVQGILTSLQVTAACACAGIVIGIVALSGAGFVFTSFLMHLGGQSLLLALILTAVAGIILGMGLPTTPAYIVLAALLVPAMVKLGVPVPAAHMFVLYFAIMSVVTPPVAISLIAANGISGAGLWESGIAAVKLCMTGYIVPFMFVYGPALLLIGEPLHVAISCVTAVIGVAALSGGLNAYFLRPAYLHERLLLVGGAFCMINAELLTDIIGVALIGIALAMQKLIAGPEEASVTAKT